MSIKNLNFDTRDEIGNAKVDVCCHGCAHGSREMVRLQTPQFELILETARCRHALRPIILRPAIVACPGTCHKSLTVPLFDTLGFSAYARLIRSPRNSYPRVTGGGSSKSEVLG